MDSPDLKAPQHYINRELSSLEFNQRVLAQALDHAVPLLERLKFLCISCSNLDEFFEIRVSGLKQLQELGGGQLAADGLSLAEQLDGHPRARHAPGRRPVPLPQRACCCRSSPPRARRCSGPRTGTRRPAQWLEQYFEREVEPVLSPAGPRSGAPVPAHPEQEPELHRAAVGQGRLRSRQRAGDRAGAALAAAHRAAAGRRRPPRLRAAVDHRRGLRAQLFRACRCSAATSSA